MFANNKVYLKRGIQFFTVFFCLLSLSTGAWGASKKFKIGYVNLQKALDMSEAGKAAKEKFSKEVQEKRKELSNRQKELNKLKEELDKQSAVLKDEVKKEKEKELIQKGREFQKLVSDSENGLRKRESELTKEIINELRVIVQDYAKENGYTYVFEKLEGGIIYAPEEDDITEVILKKYDERYKAVKK